MPASFLPLLAAATAATAPQPASDLAVLDAFKHVCRAVRDPKTMARKAKKGKWAEVATDAHPNLHTLVEGGRAATLKEDPSATMTGTQYRRIIAGRTLYLVTSHYKDKDGLWGNGCRLYHFEAENALPLDTLTRWMGRASTGTLPLPDDQVKYLWEPGWTSGHSVEVSFVTGVDPVSQQFGLKGLVLTAQAIGGF